MKKISILLVFIMLMGILTGNMIAEAENGIIVRQQTVILSVNDCSSFGGDDNILGYRKYCSYNLNFEQSGSYKISVVSKTDYDNAIGTVIIDGSEKISSHITKSDNLTKIELGIIDIKAGERKIEFGPKYTTDSVASTGVYVDGLVIEYIGEYTEYSLSATNGGVTSGKPALGMGTNSYAEYIFNAKKGRYAVYAVLMADSGQRNITAFIGDDEIGSVNFEGIGWDSRYSKEYYIGSFSTEIEEITLKIKNTGEYSFRLWNLRLKYISEETENTFLEKIISTKNCSEIYDTLKIYNDKLAIPYGDYLEKIFYNRFLLERIAKFEIKTLEDFDKIFLENYEKELLFPTVAVKQNDKYVTEIHTGELSIEFFSDFDEDIKVIAALYTDDYLELKDIIYDTLPKNSKLTLSGLKATENISNLKIFFWENMTSLKPVTPVEDETLIYVSLMGDDSFSGLSPHTPVKTIEKAVELVKKIQSEYPRNITVSLGEGEFLLENAISLSEDFWSYDNYTLSFESADREKQAVISGGYNVENWNDDDGDGIYCATLNEEITDVRQFYVNGYPTRRAKSEGYIFTGDDWDDAQTAEYSQDGFYVPGELIPVFAKPQYVEVVYPIKWALQRLPVKTVEYTDENAIIKMKQPFYSTAYTMISSGNIQPKTYNKIYFENDITLLNEPGEFYYDKETHILYYMPYDEENLNGSETVISKTEGLISLMGSSKENRIKNISFKNIKFKYGGYYTEASNEGVVVSQAENLVDADKGLNKNPSSSGNGRDLFAQINVVNAENITFNNCDISCMGSTALRLGAGVYDSKVQGCIFTDIGGSALSISTYDAYNVLNETMCIAENIDISNNVISRTGLDFMSCPAIAVYYAKNIDILHNTITETPYSAISLGWGWAWDYTLENDVKTQTPSTANRLGVGGHKISHNYIKGVSKALRDGGHIYNLGYMTSAEISNNYLLESEDAGGIYLDTGASNLTISRNVFKGCIRDSIAYGRSKHAINNTAFDNWSDNSQYITFAKDWIGEGCYLTEPYVYSNDEWPEKATGVMETAGVTDEYKINLSRITLPEWRNTAIYENLTQEIVEEGTIKIPLDSYVSYRLNNTSAEKPQTEESINRLMVLNNFIARDAILYNVEVPSDGEYIMEMRYSALSDVTDGKLLVGIAVNKNLAPLMTDPYNQIVYSDNSLICKQFTLPYEKTSRCRGTYYVFKDENGNPVKFNLKEGINEIYIGSRTTSDVVNINDIRIIPAS